MAAIILENGPNHNSAIFKNFVRPMNTSKSFCKQVSASIVYTFASETHFIATYKV